MARHYANVMLCGKQIKAIFRKLSIKGFFALVIMILSLATKLRIYTTCVLAVGLHGAETRTLLKEDSRRLQAFHMTCQRRILGIRWNDFITNKAVADSTNVPSIGGHTQYHSGSPSLHLQPYSSFAR